MAAEEVQGAIGGAAQGAAIGSIGGPVGAAIGGVIGLGLGLFSASSQKKANRKAAEAARKARIDTATEQFFLTEKRLGVLGAFEQEQGLSEKLNLMFQEKIQTAQLARQSAVQLARTRSARQISRTSGFGGSFTRQGRGESELFAERAIQEDILEETFIQRQEDVTQRRQFQNKQRILAGEQSVVTFQASARGAQAAAAGSIAAGEAQAVSQVGQAIGQFVQQPQIAQAINSFFTPTPAVTGTPIVNLPIPSLGQGPGA